MLELLVLSQAVQGVLLIVMAVGLLTMQRRMAVLRPRPASEGPFPRLPAEGEPGSLRVHTLAGEARPLFPQTGRPHLLLVTMVGCKYCGWVYAGLRAIRERYPAVAVSLLVVGKSAADAAEAVGPVGTETEVLWAPMREVAPLGLSGFPSAVVGSRQGQVVKSGVVTTLTQVGALLAEAGEAEAPARGPAQRPVEYLQ